jgi:hypothetical protein
MLALLTGSYKLSCVRVAQWQWKIAYPPMSTWAVLGILCMVERCGMKLRVVERVGNLVWSEIWDVLETCIF